MGNIANTAKGAVTKPAGGILKIWLNTDVSSERAEIMRAIEAEETKIDGRLATAKKTETPKLKQLREQLAAVETREQKHAHELYFEKMPGLDFANLSDLFPPRAGNPTDAEYGFNTRQTTMQAAKANGVELIEDPDGEFETSMRPGKKYKRVPLDDEDWNTIESVGSGFDLNGIENLILNLNVMLSSQMVARWKKD